MAEIRVEGLRHVYSAGTPFEKAALDGINLEIPQGQLVGIIGRTGSGKSTFIQHLDALLAPTEGKIYVGGKDINADKYARKAVKGEVGLVFQYPEYQLFEETVYKDIAFGPRNLKLPEEEIDARVREAAGFVSVDEALFERSPLELSGGQKRRVAIAGVIAMRPGVLVLDEPTAGLDPIGCRQILGNILAYRAKTGATVIVISHNMDDVARLAERILVFDRGRIVMDGAPDTVFADPARLTEIGLDVPHATEIAMELRLRGVALPDAIYTHSQLKAAIIAAKGAGAC
mgnify:CR=1 FL=1